MTTDTSKEVATIEKEIKPYLPKSPVKITNEVEKAKAAETLSVLNGFAKKLKARKEEITKPMNAALKSARDLFRDPETKLDDAIQQLRTGLGTYQLAAEAEARAQELKIAARTGEGKGHLKPETAVRQMGEIDRPAASVATDSGSIKFRTDKKLKITDESALLRDICKRELIDMVQLDESALLKFLKSGNTVEGAEIEEVKTVINSL